MGYSHGEEWTELGIKDEIEKVMSCLNINRMPSNSECKMVTKSSALSSQISIRGGFKYWAERLGLQSKNSDSKTGWEYEEKAKKFLERAGYDVESATVKHPYDLLINQSVKIDIKVSNLYKGKVGNFYSYNLEKKFPTCDFYILYAIGKFSDEDALIVPSCLANISQISVGELNSKWDVFSGRWDLIEKEVRFKKSYFDEFPDFSK